MTFIAFIAGDGAAAAFFAFFMVFMADQRRQGNSNKGPNCELADKEKSK